MQGEHFKIRPDFAISPLFAQSARPYLTTLTDMSLRYKEMGAWSGGLDKHDINSNIRATAPAYTPKDDIESRTLVRVRTGIPPICPYDPWNAPLPCRPVTTVGTATAYGLRKTLRHRVSGNARSAPPQNRW